MQLAAVFVSSFDRAFDLNRSDRTVLVVDQQVHCACAQCLRTVTLLCVIPGSVRQDQPHYSDGARAVRGRTLCDSRDPTAGEPPRQGLAHVHCGARRSLQHPQPHRGFLPESGRRASECLH